jgi:hypothetical protein
MIPIVINPINFRAIHWHEQQLLVYGPFSWQSLLIEYYQICNDIFSHDRPTDSMAHYCPIHDELAFIKLDSIFEILCY